MVRELQKERDFTRPVGENKSTSLVLAGAWGKAHYARHKERKTGFVVSCRDAPATFSLARRRSCS